MIEKIVKDYLEEKLDVPVRMEEREREHRFVLIQKTGSSKKNRVAKATIAIQSYGNTLYEASTLNEKVKDCMDEMVNLDDVNSCRLNTDYEYTDTETKRYRYQAIFDICHY